MEETIPTKQNIYDNVFDGSVFVPNSDVLENGVRDFNNDIEMGDLQEEEAIEEQDDDDYRDNLYDMFPDMDLSHKVPDQFQFEEDNTIDEDGVLDNGNDEQPYFMPIKLCTRVKNIMSQNQLPKQKFRRDLNSQMYVDVEGKNQKRTHPEENTTEGESFIDLMQDFSVPFTSTPLSPNKQPIYDSEPTMSDSSSRLSDSSSSTNWQKPKKFEKVKLDEARMACAPVHIVEEILWAVDGDNIYKIKCSENDWLDKYKDGRSFFIKESSRSDLKGKRKIGKCLGSMVCKRGDCPKLTTEDIVNTIDFR